MFLERSKYSVKKQVRLFNGYHHLMEETRKNLLLYPMVILKPVIMISYQIQGKMKFIAKLYRIFNHLQSTCFPFLLGIDSENPRLKNSNAQQNKKASLFFFDFKKL